MPHPDPTDARWRVRRVAARLFYVAIVLVATWRALDFDLDPVLARLRLARALSPSIRPMDVLDGVRNVALFAGLGAVWLVTADPTRLRRNVAVATGVGLALSLLAEAAQLFSPNRYASVLDLATNAGGALLGGAAVALAIVIVTRRRARTADAVVPHLLVAGPYLAACALEAFAAWGEPDRIPGVMGGFRTRWTWALADLARRPLAPPTWSDLLLFAPAGFLAARVLLERGWRPAPAALAAWVAGAVIWTASEALRGLSGAPMRPWAVALHAAASLLGAVVAAALARREARAAARTESRLGAPARPLLRRDPRAYVAVLALWSLRPFLPVASLAEATAKLTANAFVPMRALALDWSLHSVADVFIGFCLYVPVGAWFAVRPGKGGRAARSPLPGVALAFATEIVQLGVRARTVDVTDALVQAAGVLVGWAIVRRADARRERLALGDPAPAAWERTPVAQRALG